MTSWATLLSSTDSLSQDALLKLQAVAITTVGDLEFSLLSNSDELRLLVGEKELSSFYKTFSAGEDAQRVAMAISDKPPALGAVPPPEVQVLEKASEELFFATLDSLGPPPNDAQASESGGASARTVSCYDYMRPVRDQGDRGTCVAHAVSAVIESLEKSERGQGVDLSPQFLYWAAKHNDGHIDKPGTLIRVAVEQAVVQGVCEESNWRYQANVIPGNESHCPPHPGAVEKAAGRKADAVVQVDRNSSNAICELIDRSVPVAFSLPVYALWPHPAGKVPMPIPYAPLRGGHAMCAIGYRSDPTAPGGGFMTAKNSWGPDRADQHPLAPGYYDVPFEYIDKYGWEAATLRL